jgi:plasmid segregation protein ParM
MNRDHSITDLGIRAVDVGYFNVKYTLGRKQVDESWPIATGIFPAMAPRLATNTPRESFGSAKLDGFVVEVDGVHYFVGRDFSFTSTGIEPRPIAEGYCTTAKYLAQLRGALQYMAQDASAGSEVVIRHLVVALPLNTFGKYRTVLEKRIEGEHLLPMAGGSTRRITVERVSVIVQPHGALLNFGSTAQQGAAGRVDPGDRPGRRHARLVRGQQGPAELAAIRARIQRRCWRAPTPSPTRSSRPGGTSTRSSARIDDGVASR